MERAKAKGNRYFAARDYADALRWYDSAQMVFGRIAGDWSSELVELWWTLQRNSIQCYLKLNRAQDALDLAEEALLDSSHISRFGQAKALYLHAQACRALHYDALARDDLRRAIELAPEDPALKAELQQAQLDSERSGGDQAATNAQPTTKARAPWALAAQPLAARLTGAAVRAWLTCSVRGTSGCRVCACCVRDCRR